MCLQCAYLDTVLEAVQLHPNCVSLIFAYSGSRVSIKSSLSSCFQECSRGRTNLPAGVGDLATGLADYTRRVSVKSHESMPEGIAGGQGAL
jgi:hypothetical protein